MTRDLDAKTPAEAPGPKRTLSSRGIGIIEAAYRARDAFRTRGNLDGVRRAQAFIGELRSWEEGADPGERRGVVYLEVMRLEEESRG